MRLNDSDIVYFDNHMIAVNKPPLILTHPNHVGRSLLVSLKRWMRERLNKRGNIFVHPVNRLDFLVSGIVLFAKTSKALTRLNMLMKKGAFEKKYILRHEGVLPKSEGFLKNRLLKNGMSLKTAELFYRSKSSGVAEVSLITGRYHQIRRQFSLIDCPIVGDKRYGSITSSISPGIDLHHFEMRLKHPVTKEELVLESHPIF